MIPDQLALKLRAFCAPRQYVDKRPRVAKLAVDVIAAGGYEIVVDELSRTVQAGLAGGVAALYPQFA